VLAFLVRCLAIRREERKNAKRGGAHEAGIGKRRAVPDGEERSTRNGGCDDDGAIGSVVLLRGSSNGCTREHAHENAWHARGGDKKCWVI